MLTGPELERQLLDFTRSTLAPAGLAGGITADTPLFEQRVLDSLRILELIAFLESRLGRKIPDAQVVLANFRTVRTMARVFTGADAPALVARRRTGPATGRIFAHSTGRARYHADACDRMIRGGGIEVVAPGEIALHEPALALLRYFDDVVRAWAAELGAVEAEFPEPISMATLERAGFVSAFPDKLVMSADSAEALSPAICYHCYPRLAGVTMGDAGSLTTAAGRCHRAERDAHHPLERLRAFTMREIVVVGDEPAVGRLRATMITRVSAWVRALELDGFIETATDPFFTSESRGRLLAQRSRPLKYELRLAVAPERTVAAASFNDHQQHFGRAFDIRLPGGDTAHSGCVAFGWERWMLAFLAQHGADASGWPDAVRSGHESLV